MYYVSLRGKGKAQNRLANYRRLPIKGKRYPNKVRLLVIVPFSSLKQPAKFPPFGRAILRQLVIMALKLFYFVSCVRVPHAH